MRACLDLLVLLAACAAVPAQDSGPRVVAQEALGVNACGPCAIVNSLLQAKTPARGILDSIAGATPADKARSLVELFSAMPSRSYGPGQTAYDARRGMAWGDLADAFAGLPGTPKVEGAYLDRRPEEDLEAHLRRIHGLLDASLKRGLPPVASFRSFAPAWNAERKEYAWTGLSGHYVALLSVDPLAPGDKGFRFRYADSFTGRVDAGYASVDEARNFTAAKGDEKTWTWVGDRPFLLVTAPSLRLRTQEQPWFLRTTIILNHAVTAAEGF